MPAPKQSPKKAIPAPPFNPAEVIAAGVQAYREQLAILTAKKK
jgi:hypothetical protein